MTVSQAPGRCLVVRAADCPSESVSKARHFSRGDRRTLRPWLGPMLGEDAAAELPATIHANPPKPLGWQTDGKP
jgi:hypothetical protein